MIVIKFIFFLRLGHGSHWEKEGQKYLHKSLRLSKLETVAKNLIFFLGDGMGVTTVTATRIYKGQLNNKGGEEELLVFDEFPHVSLSKVYPLTHSPHYVSQIIFSQKYSI